MRLNITRFAARFPFWRFLFAITILILVISPLYAQDRKRARELDVRIGVLPTGPYNAITDVPGVKVGHRTITRADSIRTGVTAILPHGGNIFQEKVPAAVFIGNGFGKMSGISQVHELGNLETPIVLTNTLAVPAAIEALIRYTLAQPGNESVLSVNAVVGETNDGYLNAIRSLPVNTDDVLAAIRSASAGPVAEGNVGAGTGTVCMGFKGGIGTASRKLPMSLGGYTVGVLVQSNFGGVLQIDGAPVGEKLKQYYLHDELRNKPDGSCMIVVGTDAPLDARNLGRLAKRAFMGLARTGGIASNGSGDYVIAFSTASGLRVPHNPDSSLLLQQVLCNDAVSPLFLAAIEATEEAIVNSLFMATGMNGRQKRKVNALPIDQVLPLILKNQ